jgi:hypothetical protein
MLRKSDWEVTKSQKLVAAVSVELIRQREPEVPQHHRQMIASWRHSLLYDLCIHVSSNINYTVLNIPPQTSTRIPLQTSFERRLGRYGF